MKTLQTYPFQALFLFGLILIIGCSRTNYPTAPGEPSNYASEQPLLKSDDDDALTPDINFCPDNVATITEIDQDDDARVTWSEKISVPLTGGSVGVLFRNDGPGSITFANLPGSWSEEGFAIPKGTNTSVGDGMAVFNDFDWSGTFDEGVTILGCVSFTNISTDNDDGVELDLSFVRGGILHTVTVEFEFEGDDEEEENDDDDDDD